MKWNFLNFFLSGEDIVTCRPTAIERVGEHVSVDTRLQDVFSVGPSRLYITVNPVKVQAVRTEMNYS
jgi:hypothetical protein